MWDEWASRRKWRNEDCPSRSLGCCERGPALFEDTSLPLERRPIWYAECSGPDDPHCGLCRFSVHGCNDGGPSREEFLGWKNAGELSQGLNFARAVHLALPVDPEADRIVAELMSKYYAEHSGSRKLIPKK